MTQQCRLDHKIVYHIIALQMYSLGLNIFPNPNADEVYVCPACRSACDENGNSWRAPE